MKKIEFLLIKYIYYNHPILSVFKCGVRTFYKMDSETFLNMLEAFKRSNESHAKEQRRNTFESSFPEFHTQLIYQETLLDDALRENSANETLLREKEKQIFQKNQLIAELAELLNNLQKENASLQKENVHQSSIIENLVDQLTKIDSIQKSLP